MVYLSPTEYEQFGLEATTSLAWVTAASSLIDAHCRRPSLGIEQYTENLRVPAGRQTVRLSYLPLVAVAPATSPVVSARGRFGVPRNGEGPNSDLATDAAQAFSLPGAWTELDAQAIEFCCATGELILPVSVLGLRYNEVEIRYTAGFDEIPEPVKVACAQLVRNAQSTPALNLRAGRMDRMHMEYFADTLLTSDVRRLLAPCVVQRVG